MRPRGAGGESLLADPRGCDQSDAFLEDSELYGFCHLRGLHARKQFTRRTLVTLLHATVAHSKAAGGDWRQTTEEYMLPVSCILRKAAEHVLL